MTKKYSLTNARDIAREYCLFHPLERPLLCWRKMIGLVLAAEMVIIFFAYLLSLWVDTFLIYYLLGNILCFALSGKHILIWAVKLYQRYAPEEIRRKCLYKPTCSEYAILALKKHGLIKGVYKIYIRLFKTCRGIDYGIDYP